MKLQIFATKTFKQTMDTMKQSSRVQHNITKQIANLPGKCYHMMNVFGGKQEDINIWIRACKEEVKHFFRSLFNIYKHFAINPSCKGPAGLKAPEIDGILELEKDHETMFVFLHPFTQCNVGQ